MYMMLRNHLQWWEYTGTTDKLTANQLQISLANEYNFTPRIHDQMNMEAHIVGGLDLVQVILLWGGETLKQFPATKHQTVGAVRPESLDFYCIFPASLDCEMCHKRCVSSEWFWESWMWTYKKIVGVWWRQSDMARSLSIELGGAPGPSRSGHQEVPQILKTGFSKTASLATISWRWSIPKSNNKT